MSAQLLAVVQVSKEDRVQCQAPSCGHGVYKRIHVVQDGSRLNVLGSDCFQRLYGGATSSSPRYGSGDGRPLTAAERQLLLENTQRLIEAFEAERLQIEIEKERIEAARLQAAQKEFGQGPLVAQRSAVPRPPRRMPFQAWLAKLSPAQRSAFGLIRNQIRNEMRRNGMDPDLPGWVGLVDADARKRFEAQQADNAE